MLEPITTEVQTFAGTQLTVIERSTALVIASDADAATANDLLVSMRGAAKALEEKRVELKAPSLEACRRIDEFFKGPIERLTEAGKNLKGRIALFLEEQEKIRKAEEARLAEIAAKERARLEAEARRKEEAAAAERAKAEQEAENKRRAAEEAERRRKEAEEQGNAKAAEKAAAEAAKAHEAARTALEKGEAKAASLEGAAQDARTVAAAVPEPSSMMPAPAKPKGFSTRVVYGCEVVNLMELVKAVAAGQAPIGLIQANETALRQRANADKEGFNLPGCRLTKRQA
jgi:DNA repair exonuclease SbcCD ATPase subunit